MENAVTVTTDVDTEIIKADEYEASNYCTLKLDNSDNIKLIANAVNAADSLADTEGEELSVIGVLCRPGIRRARAKNQSDTPCTDTILICADGSAYFSKSEGVRRAIDNFVALGLFDIADVNNPITMKIEEIELQGGNTMKTLILV